MRSAVEAAFDFHPLMFLLVLFSQICFTSLSESHQAARTERRPPASESSCVFDAGETS